MPRLVLILLLSSIAIGSAFAQSFKEQARLDSLLAELPRAKSDTNRVRLLYRISILYNGYNQREAINYADQSLALARRLSWKEGMVYAYAVIGNQYTGNGNKLDYPQAIANYLSGLKIAEATKNKNLIAGMTGNVGRIYHALANYPQALVYYQKALKAHEQLDDKLAIATWLSNIGSIYSDQGDYPKALEYKLKSLKLRETMGFRYTDKESIVNEVGRAYLNLADYPQALIYLQNGLNLSKVNRNKYALYSSYTNLSKLYLTTATDSSATSLTTLLSSNRTPTLQKANSYADSALVLANELGLSKEFYYEFYKTQSEIQDALGEPAAALTSFKQYTTAKDRVINQQNANQITAATLQYEFNKKETALLYGQQLTAAQLQKQTLLTNQKEQAAQLATKERDVQRLQYLQERAQKQDKEKQLVIAQKEQALKSTALELSQAEVENQTQQRTYLLAGFGLLMALLGFIVYGYSQQQKANRILQQQKEEINQKSLLLEQSLAELHATQTQLVQKEKMASLGKLTAGIAHEIQNPLNFVTNFSEVSTELVTELEDEQQKPTRDPELEADLLGDLKQNLQKITHHGGRASAIVRGMLEHSRSGTGEKRLTDINALADEYLKIAYQGLRARDKGFTAELKTDFQTELAKTEAVPQELGRVLLNLYNNAFYAVAQRQKTAPPGYQPTVTVSTTQVRGHTQIRVSDNGTGIPALVQTKIFQPFFTTKPTGEGTGLGLSLSYDIITKGHQGSLQVKSQEGQGAEFLIQLPIAAVSSLVRV